MDENLRFMTIVDALKSQGIINDYVQLASSLETNKAAISDIKSGRKKLSIEMLRRLKSSYPSCNIEWVITGKGEPFIAEREEPSHNTKEEIKIFIDKISEQAQEIGRLKERIRQLEHSQRESISISTSNPITEMSPQPL